jgi:hypothetical protein
MSKPILPRQPGADRRPQTAQEWITRLKTLRALAIRFGVECVYLDGTLAGLRDGLRHDVVQGKLRAAAADTAAAIDMTCHVAGSLACNLTGLARDLTTAHDAEADAWLRAALDNLGEVGGSL